MENIIIIAVLVLLFVIGGLSTIKHFKGEGGCCGGGSDVKIKRKKLKHVIGNMTLTIEGMHCEHCKQRVESRLNELDGVSAKVDLKKKQVLVSIEKEISKEELKKVVERAGYEVVHISDEL